ncbi:MAG: hypothetical protein AAGC86_13760 [Pseudomonadota bacterium]
MKPFLIAGLTSLVLASTAVTESAAQTRYTNMSGPEIKSALVGNSLRGVDSSGRYTIHYRSDNRMRIVYTSRRGTRVENGVWRVLGNRYCRRWERLGKGKTRCVTFHRNGNKIVWVRRGEVTDHTVLLRGNPAGL